MRIGRSAVGPEMKRWATDATASASPCNSLKPSAAMPASGTEQPARGLAPSARILSSTLAICGSNGMAFSSQRREENATSLLLELGPGVLDLLGDVDAGLDDVDQLVAEVGVVRVVGVVDVEAHG